MAALCFPGPEGEVAAGAHSVRVLWAEDPLVHGQQRGVVALGAGCIPRYPGEEGEGGAGGQRTRVLWAEDPLAYRQIGRASCRERVLCVV